jgi:outer membrane biosynthesis protein TonB
VYALSWVFLAAAVGALIYGLSQEGLTFIYVSIGASVLAMLLLLVGILRKRPVQPATAGAPYGPSEEEARAMGPTAAAEAATQPATQAQTAPITPAPRKRAPSPQSATPAAAARPTTESAPPPAPAAPPTEAAPAPTTPPAKKPAAKKTAAKKPAAKKTAAAGRSPRGQVVAIPERGTYHQPGCRFVKGRRDTEKVTRSVAGRRGYTACGVCKPDAA